MKYFVPLFAAGAFAASFGTPVERSVSLVQRDAASISSAISAINDAVTGLKDSLNSFEGAGQAAALQAASEAVIDAVNSGIETVGQSDVLDLSGALELTQITQTLSDNIGETVDAAIAKKDTFVSAGVGSIVADQLQQQQSAANTFSSDVIDKIPSGAQTIAQGLIDPINANLQRAVDAFSDLPAESSAPTSGGSAPTSGASAPTSAPATTGGAAPTSVRPSATASSTPPPFTGAASVNNVGFAAAALALVAAL